MFFFCIFIYLCFALFTVFGKKQQQQQQKNTEDLI